MTTSLITGVTGQDGFYLASDLVARGVRVVGTTRTLDGAAERLGPELAGRIELVQWDLVDQNVLTDLLSSLQPTTFYNFAAFTSGELMDRNPDRVTDINGVAVLRMLEAIRHTDPAIRFCQASSSEVFAASGVSCQDENTPRVPRSVYGAAKTYADNVVRLYREKYDLFACSAYLFNHESPRRGEGFVTQKIVRAAVRIKLGKQDTLALGNLSAARDWGFAGDVVRALRLMLEGEGPRDYVVATGTAHTVQDFCELAFSSVGLDYRDHVTVDSRHYRADEPVSIVGNIGRARAELDWSPRVSFPEMIAMMIDHEMATSGERTQ